MFPYSYLRAILLTLKDILMSLVIIVLVIAFLLIAHGYAVEAILVMIAWVFLGAAAGRVIQRIEAVEKSTLLLENINLATLKKEALAHLETGDRQQFLLAQKKIMMASTSLILRSISGLDKKKKTAEIGNIEMAITGMLSVIVKLDEEDRDGD